jgi:glucose-1-phosphate thymidylyltransferase
VKQIEDPSSFGVVNLNAAGEIVDFIEKPQEFISDLAMIGIYYFKDGTRLRKELDYLIDNNVMKSGEYQLPDALRRMTSSGCVFKPGEVSEWLDCGNKEVTVHTNKRVLDFDFEKNIPLVHASAKITNSQIIPPCFIGENACIEDSIIGPHVSVGANTKIKSSILKNSNVQENTNIVDAVIFNSMIGSHVNYNGKANDLSLGDFSIVNE